MKKLNQWRDERRAVPPPPSTRVAKWTQPAIALSVILLAVCLTAGCSLFDDFFNGHEHKFVGTTAFGFEVASFEPCNGTEQWWITGGDAALELQNRYNDLGLESYSYAYARVEGVPSKRGQYGHLGAYQREFRVTKVFEVRLLEEGDCAE